MELGLSLGETTSRPPPFDNMLLMKKKNHTQSLGFCMSLGLGNEGGGETSKRKDDDDDDIEEAERRGGSGTSGSASDLPLVQLDLLPSAPVPRNNQLGFPWSSENNGNSDAGSSGQMGVSARGFDVNLLPSTEEINDGAAVSSPNSTVSSFQIDFSIYRGGGGSGSGSGGSKRDSEAAGFNEVDTERASSRASDDEDNGLTRKKLRLSKEQSAFLEESFKEHNTLNPKQKLALAKQLNLRPRQVEVWFQNRRARTKLKQTEVDCEYLKRCCETLTEENRRLQKELQELRALKTSHPYYMQLPATTLTMCPSCERVATTTNNNNSNTTTATPNTTTTTTKTDTTTAPSKTTTNNNNSNNKATAFPLNKPRFYPFSHAHQSAAT